MRIANTGTNLQGRESGLKSLPLTRSKQEFYFSGQRI